MSVQKGWRSCLDCGEVYYGGLASTCPRGGAHRPNTFQGMAMLTSKVGNAQEGWRWCRRCGALFYSGLGSGRCVDGGGHDASGSGAYAVYVSNPGGYTSGGWRWCKQCQVLHRSGGGHCPATNSAHSVEGSGDYTLTMELIGSGIAVVHEGAGDSGEIWLTIRPSGAKWFQTIRVPGGCSGSPGVAMFDGKLFIYYQGAGDCKDLWLTTYDGATFSSSMRVGEVRLSGCPSVINIADHHLEIYLQGTSGDKHLWVIACGKDGMPVNSVNLNQQIWNDPGAIEVSYSGGRDTWVFFEPKADSSPRDYGGTKQLKLMRLRQTFGPLPNTGSRGTPNAAQFKGDVYVFHEDDGTRGELWYHRINPGPEPKSALTYSQDRRVPGIGTSGMPAPVVLDDVLHVFHEGKGDSGQLWYCSSADGEVWTGDQRVSGCGVSGGCNATVYQFPS